ncbi:hypothetical protein KEM52_001890, partial [Ascosphaera acerosa]
MATTGSQTETGSGSITVVGSKRPANTNDVPDAASDATFQALVRGDRSGSLKLRGIPRFDDPHAQRQWMKQHMAAAFRWFGKLKYGEGVSGHISMRASDLVLVDGDGYIVEGGNQACINEAGFMIHSEVHKARPDVIAACHTHSIYGKTWSAFGKPVEMLSQDACNLYGKLAVYDDHGGIALAQEEGQAIAAALGSKSAVILKNHGLLTVGSTVDEAAFLFYSLERACQSQLLAEAAAANGIPKCIVSDKAAAYTAAAVQNP